MHQNDHSTLSSLAGGTYSIQKGITSKVVTPYNTHFSAFLLPNLVLYSITRVENRFNVKFEFSDHSEM